MRRKSEHPESNPNLQASFALGYLYRKIEQDLNALGAETGGAITGLDAAERVGKLLLAKARGRVLDGTQYLPQVRGDAPEGNEKSTSAASVHVHSRHKQALRQLWSPQEKARLRALRKRGLTVSQIASELSREPKQTQSALTRFGIKRRIKQKASRPASSHHNSYWAGLSPEERSAEIRRRVAVRRRNKLERAA